MRFEAGGKAVEATTGGKDFNGEQPVVILLHGAGMDHTVWSLQSRWFSHHGFSVLVPDFPGHGRSEGPPVQDAPALADWLARFMDSLNIPSARIAGHSMGSLTALEFARRHPERAERLVLFGAAMEMPVHPKLLEAANANPPDAAGMIVLWGHGKDARMGGARSPGTWSTGAARTLLVRAPQGTLAAALGLCAAYGDGEVAARAVSCPAVVVSGSDDRMTPAKAGRKLALAMANARYEEITDCGHMIMTEAPDRALKVLIKALGENS